MEKKLLEKECPNDEMLYRYIEGMLNGKERKRIERHLNQCEHCLQAMAGLMKHSLAPADSEELEELRALGGLTAEEQADEVARLNASLNPGKATGQTSTGLTIGERVRSYLKIPAIPKPAYVAVGIIGLLLILAGPRQYNIWQSNRLAESGLKEFTENYYITSTDAPRPSGGFEYSIFSNTRSNENAAKFNEIEDVFSEAILKYPDNISARIHLGTYHAVVTGELESALTEYSYALSKDPLNADILNNLGYIYLMKGEYNKAELYFKKSLNQRNDLVEAQYNLALLYNKTGQNSNAENAWRTYLKTDSTSQWSKIAEMKLAE